jgi:ketosteroid isomerase-like protein
MKKNVAMSVCLGALISATVNADTCLSEKNLMALDARYEKALQIGDVKFLDQLLAADFYWVHNLASMKEKKAELLVRIQKPDEQPKERRSHDVTPHRLGATVVLQGLSSVDKWNSDGKTFRTSRYQFMRTYVEYKGECKLLAVQTMKVWSSEGD